MKRIAWITALVLGTLAVLFLLWQFRVAFVVFLLSLATAAAVRPVITLLTKRSIKRGIAILITNLSLLVLVGGLLVILSRPLVEDLAQMTNNLQLWYENLVQTWPESGDGLQSAIIGQLPPTAALFKALGGAEGSQALQGLLGTASGLAGFLSQAVVIIILAIYWSFDQIHFERLWISLIPVERRKQARGLWRDIESGVGNYILGEVVQSYLAVLILWLSFSWIGLPQPALLAVFSSLFWFIPWLGAVLALIPVILVGLSISPLVALGAGMLTVATLALMEVFIQPLFFSRQRFNSLFLVLVVIILTQAYGLLGLILAPALAAALEIGYQHLSVRRESELRAEQVSEEISQLQSSLQNLQQRLQSPDASTTPEMVNLTERLGVLMDKTVDYLAESGEKFPPPRTSRAHPQR
jgi:putative permease